MMHNKVNCKAGLGEMMIRAFILLCFLSLLVHPGIVQAGKIYKWVDEAGKVHYSSSPRPSVIKNNKIETLEHISASGSGSASNDVGIIDSWYMKLDAGHTFKLRLRYNEFSMESYSYSGYGRRVKDIASGIYNKENRAITLTYFEHQDKAKLDKTELIELISLSDDSLELLMPNGEKWLMKRLVGQTATQFSTDIRGHWQDDKGTVYDFSHGTFEVKEPSYKAGNWRWRDPELVLDFIYDLRNPIDHQQPRQSRWNIQERTYKKMTVIDLDKKEKLKLHRIR